MNHFPGVVRLAAQLDYEVNKKHNLTVRVRDPLSGLYSDSFLAVDVLDVNDNAPLFEKMVFETQVSEAAHIGQVVLQVFFSIILNRLSKIFYVNLCIR